MKRCRKAVFKTKDAAREVGNSMVAKGMTYRFRVYRCPYCKGYYHVTHLTKSEYTRERRL